MESFFAILAVVVGWGLNEASQLYRSSREHKQAIAHALSVLLDIRFQALCLDNLISILKKNGIPGEAIPIIRILVEQIGLGKEGLSDEYESALEIVAENAPLVAYEYRSKASFPTFIKKFRGFAIEQGMQLEEFEEIEAQLNSLIIPRMDELVLDLAAIHSRKLRKDVERIISKEFEIPEEFNKYMESVKELTNQASGTPQSGAPS